MADRVMVATFGGRARIYELVGGKVRFRDGDAPEDREVVYQGGPIQDRTPIDSSITIESMSEDEGEGEDDTAS